MFNVKYMLLIFSTLFGFTSTRSATTEWISLNSDIWHEVTNWSNGIPSDGDTAIINVPNITVTLNQEVNINRLIVGIDATLKINSSGSITISGLSDEECISNSGSIDNFGSIMTNRQGFLGPTVSSTGDLTNHGKINVQGGQIGIEIRNGGQFNNYDTCHLVNCEVGLALKNAGQYIDEVQSELKITSFWPGVISSDDSFITINGSLVSATDFADDGIRVTGQSEFVIKPTADVGLEQANILFQDETQFENQGTMVVKNGSLKFESSVISILNDTGATLTINNSIDTALAAHANF